MREPLDTTNNDGRGVAGRTGSLGAEQLENDVVGAFDQYRKNRG